MTITFESATAHRIIVVDFDEKSYFIRKERTLRAIPHKTIYLSTNKEIDELEKELLKCGFLEEERNTDRHTTLN